MVAWQDTALRSEMHCSNDSLTPIIFVQSTLAATCPWQSSSVTVELQRAVVSHVASRNCWQAALAGAGSAKSFRSHPTGTLVQVFSLNALAHACAFSSVTHAMPAACSGQLDALGEPQREAHEQIALCHWLHAADPRPLGADSPPASEPQPSVNAPEINALRAPHVRIRRISAAFLDCMYANLSPSSTTT